MGNEDLPLLAVLLFLAGFFGMFFFPAPLRKALAFGVFQAGLVLYAFNLSGSANPLASALGIAAAGAGLGLLLILLVLARGAEGEGS